MAVIDVRESFESRTGSLEYDKATFRRVFLVETDSPNDGPLTAIVGVMNNMVIGIGSAYIAGNDSSPYAVLLRFDASPTGEDPLEWQVTAEYGKPPREGVADNPLDEPTTLDIEGESIEEAIERDKDGNLIENSAGDKFDPPLTVDKDRIVITITRNEATDAYATANPGYTGPVFDYATISANVGKVNSTTYLGYAARRVRMKRPRIRRMFNEDIGYYWNVVYRFEVIDEEYVNSSSTVLGSGWDRVILDSGYRFKDGSDLKMITIDGQPVQEPALLDGSGGKLSTGSNPVYLTFRVHEETDLSAIVNI